MKNMITQVCLLSETLSRQTFESFEWQFTDIERRVFW